MSFINVFFSGDWVLSAVFLILLIMSILSWYVIFYKGLKLKRQYQSYQNFAKQYHQDKEWAKKMFINNFAEFENIKAKSAVEFLLLEAKNIQKTLLNYSSLEVRKEIFTMHLIQNLDQIRFWLDRGLTILASIGSCAPFVGLFGTVWGIYHALGSIALQGSSSLNVISAPISEALIATAFGLFCAIPAVLAYNSFVRLNRLLVQNLRHLAEQLTVYGSASNLNK